MLNESVPGQMLADVPIGSFLSGGIDSSLITALMQENSHSRVNTFSIGFQETEFNEAGLQKLLQLILAQNILSFISRRMKLEKLFLRWLQSTLNLLLIHPRFQLFWLVACSAASNCSFVGRCWR